MRLRGGRELGCEVAPDAAETRKRDDKGRRRALIAADRVGDEQERRSLTSRETVSHGGVSRDVERMPARIEFGHRAHDRETGEDADRRDESQREQAAHSASVTGGTPA